MNKLKSAAKDKTGAILRVNKKTPQDEELPHQLFLTARQTTKARSAFDSWLGNLGKKSTANIVIPLARDNLPWLISSLASNVIYKFERKISRKCGVKKGKRFTLFISNEDMNDIIKVIKSLEDSGVLIDGVTETVKHEIKKQKGGFLGALLAPLAALLVQPVISSVVKGISRTGIKRAGRGYMDKNF